MSPSNRPAWHQALWSPHPRHHMFLQWLSTVFLMAFCAYLLAVTDLLQTALAADQTYISIAILLMLVVMSAWCGYRAWWLGWQHSALDNLVTQASGQPSPENSLAADYLQFSDVADDSSRPLVDVFSDRARDSHEVLWFVSATMIKAGLVGTVIGFVQMLGSVSTLESFDISQMQEVLKNMSSGMGVALYTTLVGLVSSVALGFQVLLLDRSADRLVANTVRFANQKSSQLQKPALR